MALHAWRAGDSQPKRPAAGGVSSGPGQGNAWLLSKSLPVDVRLLAAGAASAGALYYYFNFRWLHFSTLDPWCEFQFAISQEVIGRLDRQTAAAQA
jgi:hypothetical protein